MKYGRQDTATLIYLDSQGIEREGIVPLEGYALFLTGGADRFVQPERVYIHGTLAVIVLPQHGIDAHDSAEYDARRFDLKKQNVRFRPFTGEHFLSGNMQPVVNEIQARKVASQLVEGMMTLTERGMTHEDLSQRNYLVDEVLNVNFSHSSSGNKFCQLRSQGR